MKRETTVMLAFSILMFMSMNSLAGSLAKPRAAGIGMRGTYFRMNNSKPELSVRTKYGVSEVNVGGGGGWLYFFSRFDNNSILEFSLGAVGNAETKSSAFDGDDVDVEAVAAVLMGLRHELFSIYNQSAMRPYFTLGAGPYWISDISVREQTWGAEEEVTVKSRVKPGGYAGAGVNFMLTSWFGLNFDARYHFVNFNVNHNYSGWEYGMGILFTWGEFDPKR